MSYHHIFVEIVSTCGLRTKYMVDLIYWFFFFFSGVLSNVYNFIDQVILTDSYWLQLFAENSEATPGLDGKVCCDQLMMSAMIS